MTNRLDRDFHLPGLLRFALPTIIMMLVVSLYTIVDGVLIARLVGENALAAANVAYPAISFTLAMGIMLGTGGSAVVAHKMGAGYLEEARRDFGFLALVAVCIGLAVCLTGVLFSGPLARLLGASDLLLDDTVTYLRVQLCFAPMAMLQLLFESFFVTAGRPGLGLGLAVANRLKKAAGFHLVDADRPILIGLTGGTGAGKTSALAALEDLGGTVLDCDAVYHEMLRTDPALRGAIEGAFGPVFGPDGALDRQKLGNIVFSDPAALERLNAIVYDYLPPELMRRAAGQSLVGLDAINLVESGLDRLCACTVAVLAPAEDRVRRIMARDGISEDYARLRISAQPSDGFYREHCSHILENTCAGPAQFRDQARIFFRKILREIEHI